MPFDDIAQQTDAMSELSSLPSEDTSRVTDPMGGIKGQGGPGIDTPAEQQAVQMFLQGMQMIRQGAQADPSTKPIIDKFLQDAFLQLSQHYGYGEEGKMALKQAQMMETKTRSQKLGGGPPMRGAPPTGPPPMGNPARDQMITY